jgi:hypothetical protein
MLPESNAWTPYQRAHEPRILSVPPVTNTVYPYTVANSASNSNEPSGLPFSFYLPPPLSPSFVSGPILTPFNPHTSIQSPTLPILYQGTTPTMASQSMTSDMMSRQGSTSLDSRLWQTRPWMSTTQDRTSSNVPSMMRPPVLEPLSHRVGHELRNLTDALVIEQLNNQALANAHRQGPHQPLNDQSTRQSQFPTPVPNSGSLSGNPRSSPTVTPSSGGTLNANRTLRRPIAIRSPAFPPIILFPPHQSFHTSSHIAEPASSQSANNDDCIIRAETRMPRPGFTSDIIDVEGGDDDDVVILDPHTTSIEAEVGCF